MNRRAVCNVSVLTLSLCLGTMSLLRVTTAHAQAPDLDLPSEVVQADTLYTPDGDSTFAITLSGVGEGHDVADGTYDGWCVENNGRPNHFQVMLYSTYDPAMPSDVAYYESDTVPLVVDGVVSLGDPVPWDRLNYLLNHKQGGREDIQAAIWELIWGDATTLELTADALAMLDDAEAFGDGYEPGPGDVVAVILYLDGLQQEGYQEVVIEVPVPESADGAIGDFVWEDLDGDGRQAEGEPGIADVLVGLLLPGGDGACGTGDEVWQATTNTDSSGHYLFDGLHAGTYCVHFTLRPGMRFTERDQGDDQFDSDADPLDGATGLITLEEGQTRLDIDAGMVLEEPCTPPDTTTLFLGYRDADGAVSTVDSASGTTHPLEIAGDVVTTELSGTTTAAVNPLDGLIYLATGEGDDRLYTLDPTTGEVTLVGPLTGGASNLQAMDFAPAPAAAHGFVPGGLYGISIDGFGACNPNCLFRIDFATGEATPLAALAANQIRGASFHPATGELWVYDPGGKTLSTVLPDGTMTPRMRIPDSHQDGRTGVDTVFSLAHGCDGTLYGVDVAYGVLVRIDLTDEQAYWVSDFGTAASVFGSFEGSGLDAMDPEACTRLPDDPPESVGGGTYESIDPDTEHARTVPGCSMTGAQSPRAAWLLLLGVGLIPAVSRRRSQPE